MSWNAKRYQDRNRHHLIPKSRGGERTPENLLLMKIERHEHWHKVFGVMTIEEVIQLLQRVVRMKSRQRLAA